MQWEQLLIIASMVLVSISFTFPFSYLFNSQYLLFAFGGVLFVLYLIIISLFIPNLNDIIRDITQMVLSLENYWVYLLVIAAMVFLTYPHGCSRFVFIVEKYFRAFVRRRFFELMFFETLCSSSNFVLSCCNSCHLTIYIKTNFWYALIYNNRARFCSKNCALSS